MLTETAMNQSARPISNPFIWEAGIEDRGFGRDDQQQSSKAVLYYDQDNEIYGEGEKATSYFKVLTGFVRTCKYSSDGRRQVDAFYGPGEIFGIELGTVHPLTAEAVCDCKLAAFGLRDLESAAVSDLSITSKLLSHTMISLGRAQEHARLLGRRTAIEKVASFLLELMSAQDGAAVDLAMSRQDIADYVGLTIETVSRTLSQLEREGTIEIKAARHILLRDREALEEISA